MRAFNLSVCVLSGLLLGASASAQSPNTTLTANAVYEKNCAKCHGKTAEGRHFGGPSLVSDEVRKMSTEELRAVIANGKHRMPKYAGKLTPEQIDTLVSQIKAADQK